MSTKGSNTVSRHHGETLPTLHVRGKVNGASWEVIASQSHIPQLAFASTFLVSSTRKTN